MQRRVRSGPSLGPGRVVVATAAVAVGRGAAARVEVAAAVAVAAGAAVARGLEWEVRTRPGLVRDRPVPAPGRHVQDRDRHDQRPALLARVLDHAPAHRTRAGPVPDPHRGLAVAVHLEIQIN